VTYTGPGRDNARGLPELFDAPDDFDLSNLKEFLFLDAAAFKRHVLDAAITPCFASFRTLLETLRSIIFSRTESETSTSMHDRIIQAMEEHLGELSCVL